MERSSILKDNRQLEFNLYYTEKPPEFSQEQDQELENMNKQLLEELEVSSSSSKSSIDSPPYKIQLTYRTILKTGYFR